MLPCTKDIYGGFVINGENIKQSADPHILRNFLKQICKGQTVKVNVTHKDAVIIPMLKQLKFEFFYGNNDFTQWVYKNESPIPDYAVVSSLRSHIVLIQNNHVLFTEQKINTELSGMMILPGGNVNHCELPYDAGIREVAEEVGLTIKSMQLIGILTRLNVGSLETTDVNFYYVTRHFEGIEQIQISEISQSFWVPIEVCINLQEYHGLKISKLYNQLILHILGKSKHFYHDAYDLNFTQPGFLQLIPERKTDT